MKRLWNGTVGASLAAMLLLTGCANPLLQDPLPESSAELTASFPRYDIDGLKTRIEALKSIWKESDRKEDIEQAIKEMLLADDEAYAISVRAEIAYNAEWSDPELYDAYTETRDDSSVVDEMVTWCFVNGARYSAYPECFEKYIDDSWADYYAITNLNRVMSSARMNSGDSGARLDEYYDTAYDSDLDVDEMNKSCAKLYLELLKEQDLSDYLYSNYDRDYTAEEASEAAAAVLAEIVPVAEALYARMKTDPEYDQVTGDNRAELDAYALLKEYAPQISPRVAQSVDKLFSKELYTVATGDDCYDGSFTVALPSEQSALMYTYLCNDFYDLITVTHEFGHFHSDWRDQTHVYLQANNIDLAEAQSQGMEMLFTAYYDEIFGEHAKLYEKVALYNILNSVIAGLAIGEFEYRVMQNIDSFTPDDVIECYYDLDEQYGIDVDFYEVTHLFEQPGYYVSYGVSALPALELYTIMQEDYDRAVKIYDILSSISSSSGEYHFIEAIEACGLRDPFDPETVADLAHNINRRLDELD